MHVPNASIAPVANAAVMKRVRQGKISFLARFSPTQRAPRPMSASQTLGKCKSLHLPLSAAAALWDAPERRGECRWPIVAPRIATRPQVEQRDTAPLLLAKAGRLRQDGRLRACSAPDGLSTHLRQGVSVKPDRDEAPQPARASGRVQDSSGVTPGLTSGPLPARSA